MWRTVYNTSTVIEWPLEQEREREVVGERLVRNSQGPVPQVTLRRGRDDINWNLHKRKSYFPESPHVTTTRYSKQAYVHI